MNYNHQKQVHATCISQDGSGILIRGLSGTGKSDLALRLISDGAQLVADDQVTIDNVNGSIIAWAPPSLKGLLEVRGIGIIRMPSLHSVPIRLLVDLNQHENIQRIPNNKVTKLAGVNISKIDLWAFETSAVAKVKIALDLVCTHIVFNDE